MKPIITIFLVLFSIGVHAQTRDQLISASTAVIEAEVDLAREQLNITNRSEVAEDSRIGNINLVLREGNLIVNYQLEGAGRSQYYQVDIGMTLDGQPLTPRPESLSGDLGRRVVTENRSEVKSIVWTSPLETYPTLRGNLIVTLTGRLYGAAELPYGIDCDNPPTFTSKQQMPHYIAAGVGVVSIIGGQALLSQADKTYENDYLGAGTATAAEPFYQDANDKRHTALIMTYAGAGILVVDAVWYFWRLFRYKKQSKAFDQYCGEGKVMLRPVYQPVAAGANGSSVGLSLKVRF